MRNKVAILAGSVVGVAAMAAPALAEGVADATVVSSFTTISDNVVATMGAIAPVALLILAIFLGFRYGKKIFKLLSNG